MMVGLLSATAVSYFEVKHKLLAAMEEKLEAQATAVTREISDWFTRSLVMGGLYAYNRHVLAPLIDHLELDTNTQLPNNKTFKHQVTQDYLSKDQKGMLVIFSIE